MAEYWDEKAKTHWHDNTKKQMISILVGLSSSIVPIQRRFNPLTPTVAKMQRWVVTREIHAFSLKFAKTKKCNVDLVSINRFCKKFKPNKFLDRRSVISTINYQRGV